MLPLSITDFPVLSVRLTLAITWPQRVHGMSRSLTEAAQVNGDVSFLLEGQSSPRPSIVFVESPGYNLPSLPSIR